MILPGEDPLILGRCNYDTLSPKRHSDVSVMELGVSDEAIVDVKRVADEGAVTGRSRWVARDFQSRGEKAGEDLFPATPWLTL